MNIIILLFKMIALNILTLFFSSLCIPNDIETSPNKTIVYGMDSITELVNLVAHIQKTYPKGEIIIAYDWDNTISLENGSHLPFREGDITSKVINDLFKLYHTQFFVLTSRFEGRPAQDRNSCQNKC